MTAYASLNNHALHEFISHPSTSAHKGHDITTVSVSPYAMMMRT